MMYFQASNTIEVVYKFLYIEIAQIKLKSTQKKL